MTPDRRESALIRRWDFSCEVDRGMTARNGSSTPDVTFFIPGAKSGRLILCTASFAVGAM